MIAEGLIAIFFLLGMIVGLLCILFGVSNSSIVMIVIGFCIIILGFSIAVISQNVNEAEIEQMAQDDLNSGMINSYMYDTERYYKDYVDAELLAHIYNNESINYDWRWERV